MTYRYVAPILLVIVSGIAGCQSAGEETAPDPVAAVRVARATIRDFDDRLTVYGTVELTTSRSATVSVQTEAQVVDLYVFQGGSVRQGERLMRLVGSANARLDSEKAERDAQAAANEAARVGRLHADGLATNSEWEAARDVAATAIALRDSLIKRTGQSADGIVLIAPRSGIVESLTAQPGDILAPGTVAARIADPAAWQVRLGIDPSDVHRLRKGQAVALSALTASDATAGEIKFVDGRIDAQTRLASAFVSGRESLPIPPGASVRGDITLATHGKAVAVPRSAVLFANEKPYVFVAEKEKVQRRDIEIGFRDDSDIEILKGVAAGESVVVLGNDELSDGMSIRIQSEEGQAAS